MEREKVEQIIQRGNNMVFDEEGKSEFEGKWQIYKMELWDEDYINMEVQAYIEIDTDDNGRFQFGLVYGEIRGESIEYSEPKRLTFTWGGSDECDPASGRGWVELKGPDLMRGKIKFHRGDSSKFLARRIKKETK